MSKDLRRSNSPRDRPKKHYTIVPNDDGLVDVSARVVRGVVPWNGIEEIRARYDAWCESGEVIDL